MSRLIGRARGDLQYRLREAACELATEIQRRYAEATDRMSAALRVAQDLRDSSASEAERREQELASRERVLRGIAASLERQAAELAPAGFPAGSG